MTEYFYYYTYLCPDKGQCEVSGIANHIYNPRLPEGPGEQALDHVMKSIEDMRPGTCHMIKAFNKI